jgi:hypothetical protein
MVARFIARLMLFIAVYAISVGNFWFTFGIWPQSWAAFTLFTFLSFVVMCLGMALSAEESK